MILGRPAGDMLLIFIGFPMAAAVGTSPAWIAAIIEWRRGRKRGGRK